MNPEKTAKDLLKHFGKWAGDDAEEIIKLIQETRSEADSDFHRLNGIAGLKLERW